MTPTFYHLSIFALLCFTVLIVPTQAQEKAEEKTTPDGIHEIILADPKTPEDVKLPNVLLIGDSISMGYAPTVVQQFKGKANIFRLSGTVGATVNGALRLDSANAVNKIDGWLAAKKWSLIHFNWGLHDIKLDAKDQHQVPLEDYEKNLQVLVEKLKASGAKLIWASTTPVPDGKLGPKRQKGDEETYNAVARRIMEENKISINDLHGFITPHLATAQQTQNVHFTPQGSKMLGEEVASRIRALLVAETPATKDVKPIQ